MTKYGGIGLGGYRAWVRLRDKLFSLSAQGAFASFGERSVIQLPVRLAGESHVVVGADVFVGAGSWIQVIGDQTDEGLEPEVVIGDGTSMAGLCVISAAHSIRIGRKVLFARNVYVADHGHAFADATSAILDQGVRNIRPVVIGDGAWLGQNVFVGPGVTVGAGAVVGANSVVLSDIPPRSVAVGAPARVIRTLDEPDVAGVAP